MAYPPDDFHRIYRTYWTPLNRFFRGRGFSKEDAEDLTQETFFRVYRYMETYEDRDRFAAWLFTVARSVCQGEWQRLAAQKRKGTEVPHEDESRDQNGEGEGLHRTPPPLQEPPQQEKKIHESEVRDRLRKAIEELSRQQRRCLTLWLSGHRYKEIAKLLRISGETVKQHLAAARRRLRKLLGDFFLPDWS